MRIEISVFKGQREKSVDLYTRERREKRSSDCESHRISCNRFYRVPKAAAYLYVKISWKFETIHFRKQARIRVRTRGNEQEQLGRSNSRIIDHRSYLAARKL